MRQLLLDLLHHVVYMEVLSWDSRVFKDPEHVYESILHKSLVVYFEMDSMQSLSYLHEIFSIPILCSVLKTKSNLEEGLVILLFQI